ncbi:MAG TPA: glucosaminidase domain-containing protein [Herpetosiphonaceae bacterium]|nr:glucosaminidase domain-containing protein [Herpetosiphonaceae bacterium]
MRGRQWAIAAVALLVIWMLMPSRSRSVVSTAPGLAGTFSPLGGDQAAAALEAPQAGLAVQGPPTISVPQIERVLAEYNSPAQGHGQEIFDLGLKYGINPAISLAFFIHESGAGSNPRWAGWKPDGTTTNNIGNIICTPGYRCHGRFRDYNSWAEGIEDWYKLIDDLYVREWGRRTVDDIIPKYAPASDNNDEGAYINSVKQLVDTWQRTEQ